MIAVLLSVATALSGISSGSTTGAPASSLTLAGTLAPAGPHAALSRRNRRPAFRVAPALALSCSRTLALRAGSIFSGHIFHLL